MMEQIYLFAGFGAVPTSGEIYISPLLAAGCWRQLHSGDNEQQRTDFLWYNAGKVRSGICSL
jgi:hypothetical protein